MKSKPCCFFNIVTVECTPFITLVFLRFSQLIHEPGFDVIAQYANHSVLPLIFHHTRFCGNWSIFEIISPNIVGW